MASGIVQRLLDRPCIGRPEFVVRFAHRQNGPGRVGPIHRHQLEAHAACGDPVGGSQLQIGAGNPAPERCQGGNNGDAVAEVDRWSATLRTVVTRHQK